MFNSSKKACSSITTLMFVGFCAEKSCSSFAGTLGKVYDADGEGDFDVEDAKVLLGESE